MSKRKIVEPVTTAKSTSVTNQNGSEGGSPPPKLAPIFSNEQHGTWKIKSEELMIYAVNGLGHKSKIAGFDLDGTLIKTKSGKVFPTSNDDWQFWSRNVVTKLRRIHEEGFKLCIFTNQMGIQQKRVNPNEFKRKIQNICTTIGVPLLVFISIGSLNYRKPYIGMWTRLEEHENGGIKIDRAQSFYVGDAAGRVKSEIRTNADHSCVDRLFALNLGLKFMTPEQFFADQPEGEAFEMPQFNPVEHLQNASSNCRFDPYAQIPGPSQPELLVSIGPPASSKSTFALKINKREGANYVIVNQDKLGTWKACLEAAKRALASGKSAIIDNTNRDIETRKRYIDLAASMKVPCRCLLFECTQSNAIHNNNFRKIVGIQHDKAHKNVDHMAIRQFFANYKEPTLNEGFAQIMRINFLPHFENEEHRKIYGMYLTEK